MFISPSHRPLMRDFYQDNNDAFTDEMFLELIELLHEVRYLSAFLGDDYDLAFSEGFELN